MRPVGISITFALLTVVFCFSMKYCAKATAGVLLAGRAVGYQYSTFLLQTLFLIGMVTVTSYAGTSNLFAMYLADVCIS